MEALRSVTVFLEAIAANRELLREVLPMSGSVCTAPSQRRTCLIQSPGGAECRRRRANGRRRETNASRPCWAKPAFRALRRKVEYTTPNVFAPENMAEQDSAQVDPQHCYVCKQKFTAVHHFYDQMCPPCAEFNFNKRTELADLRGRVALLTGGRVKIGYQAGIKLLRAGAHLIVTTRFPRDSAQRYAREPDFSEWGHRLEIFGLDLRSPSSVEALCAHLLVTQSRLDFIINNACQTVRRPPEFYAHMMEGERAALEIMPPRPGGW
jgi:hypothetical protein